MRIPSGKVDQYIYFVGVDSTDLKTRKTGLSGFTVYRSRNGGAATVYTTPTINETDSTNMPGVYELLLDEDTTIAAGSDSEEYAVHITVATMAPVTRTVELYRRDTTTGNTLDVTATGAAGIDWGNVENKTTANALTATSIITTQQVDVNTIKTNPVVNGGTVTFPTNATLASTTNITAGTITTATNVTTVNGLAANVITAASMAADASAEIADAVWDEDATAHQTQGTFGQAIGDPVADTNSIYKAVVTDATGATVGVDVVAIKAETASILTDTAEIGAAGAGLTVLATQASVNTIDDFLDTEVAAILAAVDTEVAAILADTNELQTDWANGGRLDLILDARSSQASVDVIDGIVDSILVDTAEIGAAGAGLTSVALADTTSDAVIADAVWNAATASYGTAGTYGLLIETDLDATISSRMATYTQPTGFLAATFPGTVASTTNITAAAGCAVSSIGANVITAAATAADFGAEIADAVWDEAIAGHAAAGSTGEALSAAGSAGDPWTTALPGAYGAGTAGKIIGDNINATISSRASQTTLDTLDDFVDTEVAAIKAKTDQMVFTTANQLDATAITVSDKTGYRLSATGVDDVWDEATAGHTTAGTTGKALTDAGSAGDPWTTAVPGAYVAGSAGYILGTNLDATVSSRFASASYTAPLDAAGTRTAVGLASANLDTQLSTIDDFLDTEIAAIKTKTDFLPSATAGAAGGLFIAGTNAATTITTALTANIIGNITGNLSGSVASVTAGVTLAASAVQAIWDAATSALSTVGSIGKLLVDNVNATISSRASQSSVDDLPTNAELATALGTADDAVLAAVAAVDGKIDIIDTNVDSVLVDTGADIPATLATIAGYVDTEVAAIKAKTDLIPAAPAAVGDIPTANQNADALLDRAAGVETNRTIRQAMRLMLASLTGKLSGAATTTIAIRDTNDTVDRITATVDSNGNRSSVTLDAS